MSKRILTLAALLLCGSFCAVFAADAPPDMQPGLWEITMEIDMPGMPVKMPPMTHTQCITQKDLVPRNTDPEQQCKIIDTRIEGDTVTWQMACTAGGQHMTADGRATYYGDKFDGAMQMNMEGQNMQMEYRMTGHRVGPCQ